MEERYTELAVKLQEVDSRSKSNEHRIDDLDAGMEKMQETQIALIKIANSVENMGQSIITIKDDVRDVKESQDVLTSKVTEIENRPAMETKKRWDNISDKLLWLIIGGIAVGILTTVLPNVPW